MKQFILLLLLLLFGYGLCNFDLCDKNIKKKLNYRLPNNTKPLRYELVLETDLYNFNGSVLIEIIAIEDTNQVTLHTKDLIIDDFKLTKENGDELSVIETVNDRERDFFIISLTENLYKNQKYFLNFIHFHGTLSTDNDGFYLALYEDENGETKRMATTQFESLGARKAFPCYDEPVFKASFAISIIRPESYSSISNEVLKNSENVGAGKIKDTYAETVIMSSYALAFVVSQYSYVEAENQRVYARPAAVRDGLVNYALKTGIDVLNAFGNYLEIPYVLDKMDQIAIPDKYYASGAMENWGLVTYRESYLLYSEETGTADEEESTTTVIAHEFGHQWFGNLVTLKWWRYLWLNEGFANFMEYLGTDMIKPSWKILEKMVVTDLQYALGRDSRSDSQPLNYETEYPGGGATTYVSYQKGGSVLRMVQNFLTPEIFQRGLNLYLRKFAFQPVEPDNLFDSWQEIVSTTKNYLSSKDTVNMIMTPWISQAGYPVVNVVRDLTNQKIQFYQERFMNANERIKESSIWPIPINIAYSGDDFKNTTPEFWLKERQNEINDTYDVNSWIIVNKQQTGYYRVNYDVTNWKSIISFLTNNNYKDINLLNRAQIIDDSFKLAKAGHLDYEIPLSLNDYLQKETEYVPLLAMQSNFHYIRKLLFGSNEFELFEKNYIKILENAIKKLGYFENNNDKHIDKINRSELVSLLCSMNVSKCIKNAQTFYRSWKINDKTLSTNLQIPYFCTIIKLDNNNNEFNYLFSYLNNLKNKHLRLRIIKSLGCTRDRSAMNKLFDMILSDEKLSCMEKDALLKSLYNNNEKGLENVLEFVENNITIINEKYNFDEILKEISGHCITYDQYLMYHRIISKYTTRAESNNELIRVARKNALQSQKNLGDVKKWLISKKNMK